MHDETTIDSGGVSPEEPRAFVAFLDEAAGELVPLMPDVELSIGRSRSCHVVIEDRSASRLQATLRWDGGASVQLTDRSSRNGTFVGERRVQGDIALKAGDIIRIGETRLVIILESIFGTEATQSPPFVADPKMRRVLDQIEVAAKSETTVLLVGETGVGKEVLARHLHGTSGRIGRFVAINCGAIPETLAESVLFGHEAGAFTGASHMQRGVFEAASCGTLFLDEVGELSPRMQARLLRVLETKELTRVGATESIIVDVRVVSATHRELRGSERFREDLYYRLAVLTFEIPPLRDRPGDIAGLAQRFAQELDGTLTEDALALLQNQPWPGNVRELHNVLEAAFALSETGRLDAVDLPLRRNAPVGLDGQLDSVERDQIVAALESCGGNQSAAARRLGISRRALIYRMEKHGLKPRPASAKD